MTSIQKQVALLVVPDPEERGRYGDWLERRGMEVLECPGPTGEGRCVGLRSGRCPLSEAADVVVLDHRAGLPRELETQYLSSGPRSWPWGPRTLGTAPCSTGSGSCGSRGPSVSARL